MEETAAERVVRRCRELATCTEVEGETTRLYLCGAMGRCMRGCGGGWRPRG